MDYLQIELLYCQYGWPAQKVARTLGIAETYVHAVIREHGYVQGEETAESSTDLVVSDGGEPSAHLQAIQSLKDKEVNKQALLAPLLAVTEIALVGAIRDVIAGINVEESDAHIKITNMVKAYKQLTQDSVTAKVVNEANDNPGIAIQVITQIT